jgi:hypothetical protein
MAGHPLSIRICSLSRLNSPLLTRFNHESDTLIILCRNCTAGNKAVKAGFKEEQGFNMMGGIEGGKKLGKAEP